MNCPGCGAGSELGTPRHGFSFSCGMAARSGSGSTWDWLGSIGSDCTLYNLRKRTDYAGDPVGIRMRKSGG